MKKKSGAKKGGSKATATPIAIVGIGAIFPKAEDKAAFWSNIKGGVDAITEVPASHWKAEDYFDPDPKSPDRVYAKQGGFLSPIDFNPMEYGILPNALEAIDTSQLLGLVAVDQALKDAGYSTEKEFDRDKVSVILGVTGTLELVIPLGARLGHPKWREALKDAGVDDAVAEDAMKRMSDSYVPWQENSFPGLLGNVVAGRISKHFNFGGTNCVCDAACGSSLSALNLAALELEAGKADMVVTGGIDTFNDIFMYTCFSKTPALSPTGHARPFDADADGTTLGEGLGIVVLKRLADAERDGDKIYAVIKGIGASSDGRGAAIYEPNAQGQKKALIRAYEQGGVSPETIELIEGHGTGTKVGDAIEATALREVFGEADSPRCAIGSVKSQIGHTKAAAGAAGLIKAALSLYNKTLPPTIKVKKPQDTVASGKTPFYVNTEARPWFASPAHPRRAGVSALGFGGSNFHCLLEEYEPVKAAPDWRGDVQIVSFSAMDEKGIESALKGFHAGESWNDLRLAADESRRNFDEKLDCRLVMVMEKGKGDPASQVKSALTMLAGSAGKESWSTPDGTFFARGEKGGKLAMIFPGQGAQYTGMLKDLAIQFPQFMETISEADSALKLPEDSLHDVIYPRPAFDPAAAAENEARLTATELAQPAIGAVSMGAKNVLSYFGISADVFAGHSYGELPALCAGGYFDSKGLYAISRLRGELMAAGKGDRGSMLAVSAPMEQIEKFLEEEKLDLILANRNTPGQGVLSGPSDEIDKAVKLLEQQGLRCKQLSVAAAFHSGFVADASVPFGEGLKDISFKKPVAGVFSNTTGETYPSSAQKARKLLADQLARPVDFISEIENIYAAGARTFLEAGPGARLTGMVKAILGEREYEALSIDSSGGKRSGINDLARTLAQLAVLGYEVKLDLWDGDFAETHKKPEGKKPGLTVSLTGANYFNPPPRRPAAAPKPLAAPVVPPAAKGAVERDDSATASTDSASLQQALNMTRQSMQALQDLQQQTSRLHQQFLEGQESATRTFLDLVEKQQHLLQGAPVTEGVQAVGRATVKSSSSPAPVKATLSSQPVASASTPGQEPAPVPAPVQDDGKISATLLEVIAEKTGYPLEMLEMGMTLDSDLGIDSIKRVEILSALQEKLPEAPVVSPEDLGALQTLGQIVDHLGAGMPSTGAAPQAAQSPAPALDNDKVSATLLEVIAEKTGYPVEMLEMGMTLDSDLGIDSIKRVEILSALQEKLPEAPVVSPEDLGALQTLGQIVDHLGAGMPSTGAAPQAAQSPAPALDNDKVSATLLEVIAEKTGYPVEMLEMGMILDSDLGIDSIKRVEILSALQEKLPEAPVVSPEDLGALQTLGQIVNHLSMGDKGTAAKSRIETRAGHIDRGTVSTALLEVIADKTGYPIEMLEMSMALDSDLGIDSIKRVEILSALQERLPEAPAIKPEHLGTLQTVGQIVDFLASVSGAPAESTPVALPVDRDHAGTGIDRQVLKVAPLQGKGGRKSLSLSKGAKVWIAGEWGAEGQELANSLCRKLEEMKLTPSMVSMSDLDGVAPEAALAGLIVIAPPSGTDDKFLKNAFKVMQMAGPSLNRSADGYGAFFATLSRLNGTFGLAPGEGLSDPLSGGLAGLAKTAGHEWENVNCKAIDLASGLEDENGAAGTIVEEIITEGPAEVGISARGLHYLKLSPADLPDDSPDLPVGPGDVVVVSGGARGVTAEVAAKLAASAKCTLLLLGRSAMPAEEPGWLSGLTAEGEIKKELIAHTETPLKPKDVERKYREVLGGREIVSTIKRIEAAGGKALYRSVDLRDAASVKDAIDDIRREYGPVKGLIHGAGVLADRLIKDKTMEQFEQVYSTKVDGLRALLGAVSEDDLSFMVMFSSSTGRFGRTGQVDYAVANEVLNKMAQQQARLRPNCRVVSLNWGPWDGGMVTPALKKVFEQEGVGVIDLKAGAEYLVNEISTRPGGPVELVILGGREEAMEESEPKAKQNIYVSKAFDLDVSVDQYPFLKSHVIDGKAVLPMAMIIEWMAHGAIHNNPGLKFHGFNDLRVLKGVILEPGELYSLQVTTGKAFKSGGSHVVPVELSGTDGKGQQFVHARAKIVLSAKLPKGKAPAKPMDLPAYGKTIEDIYSPDRLFHGPDFHGIREVAGCSKEGITSIARPAPLPSKWINDPLRNSWLSDPLVLDSSFQMMILWSFERYNSASLPVFAGRYRQYSDKFPETGAEIRIRVSSENKSRASAEVDFVDPKSGALIARIEDYECVIDASLNESFQRNKLQGVA